MDARTANTKLQLYKLIHFSRERDISSATADSLINMVRYWYGTGTELGLHRTAVQFVRGRFECDFSDFHFR